MQNLVVFMEPSEEKFDTSLKAGNLIFNRFLIDEDAAFELSGINYLKKSSHPIEYEDDPEFELKRIEKGMEYSFWRS